VIRLIEIDDGLASAEFEAQAVEQILANWVLQLSANAALEPPGSGDGMRRLDLTVKVQWSELHQQIADLAIEAGGLGALTNTAGEAADDGRWRFAILHSRAESIYGGTSEIQRNIIAERGLGLPREPRR
jgi:alkylation response protein AidB-like acyl-CoA dehydrogenase